MTITKRLAGLAAVMALAAILVGAPALLWMLGKPHLPSQLPSWAQVWATLTSRDDGTLVIVVLFALAWVAWLYLTIALLVEIGAALRHVQAPRLPGFSLPQGFAKRLVGAAMLAFMAAPALAGTSNADTTVPPAPITPITTTAEAGAGDAAPADAPVMVRDVATHVVGPGDTLVGLAGTYLGDPDRYVEIFEANRGVVQANGSVLTDPDLIVDGTVLRITLDTSSPAEPDPTPAADEMVRDVATHVVGPGDTLVGLAGTYLGDPDRYVEIFEANRGVVQANGSVLTDPDLIVDGTVLRITLDTSSPAKTDLPETSDTHESDQTPAPSTTAEPTTAEPTATPTTTAATQTPQPTSSTTAPTPASQDASQPQIQLESSHPLDDGVGVRTVFGVGGIAAAGMVGLLSYRRLLQRRRRNRGAQLAMPEGVAALVEHQLRTVGDPLALKDVDRALRGLAQHCRDTGIGLPDIRIARLTSSAFEIYLNEPEQLPAPWVGISEGTMWSYQAGNDEDTTPTDNPEGVIPAPYPALVTLGQDLEDAHILVDLESVGQINVQGPHDQAGQVLAAMALELATSHWADDLTVTLVGSWPEMEDTLKTGNIRYLPTVGRLFQELQQRAENDRLTMQVEDAEDLHHARVTATAPSTWFPEIVLLTQPLTAKQNEQLQTILNGLPRVAIASVAISEQPSEWTIALNGDDQPATLEPWGLTIIPQHISTEAYHSFLGLIDTTDRGQDIQNELTPTVVADFIADASDYLSSLEPDPTQPAEQLHDSTGPTPEPQTPATDQAAEEEPVPADATRTLGPVDGQPYLRLLGQVDLIGAEGPVDDSRKARFTEYLAYLLLNPGAKPGAIDEAIWPNRRSQDNTATRNPATSRLRKWLGSSDDGSMRLDLNTYQIRDVGCDWLEFLEATSGALESLTRAQLEDALGLVHGAPLKGASVRYWAWAEPVQQQMFGRIVDVCYELALRQLVDEDYHGAEETLAVGLDVEPGDEQLWRMRIVAAHARRNESAVEEATNRLFAQLEAFDCAPEQATDELLRQVGKGASVTDLMEMI